MKKISRRSFVKGALVGGLVGSMSSIVRASYFPKLNLTPPEIEGPFYPIIAQKDKDFDLTSIEGRAEIAKGQVIMIEGQVLDASGTPVPDSSVEIWQANAAGRYNHPHDPNKAPLDPNFQGWAIVPSGENGRFRFKTVYPGTYPASKNWIRPPHIHFKVTKLGYIGLITQMYFPNHPLNKKDLLLNRKGIEEQKLMIAKKRESDIEAYSYSIVLQKA